MREEDKTAKKTEPAILIKMRGIVVKSYSNHTLQQLYNLFLSHFFSTHRKDFDEIIAPRCFPLNLKKDQIFELWAIILTSRELFTELLSIIPEEIRQIFYILTWDGVQKVGELEKKIKAQILMPPKEEGWSFFYYYEPQKNVDKSYLFFCFERGEFDSSFVTTNKFSANHYHIYLPEEIRQVLKTYLTPPAEYNLLPLSTIPEVSFLYKSEGEIFKELPLYYEYIRQGYLPLGKDGKPLKASLKLLMRSSTVKEFYEESNKDLEYLKTNLMVAMLNLAVKAERPKDPLSLLKEVFDCYLKQAGSLWSFNNLLFHLKSKSRAEINYYFENKKKINSALFFLLRELPSGQWVSIENLLRFIELRDINLNIVEKFSASKFLYYVTSDRYEQRVYIAPDHNFEAIVAPLVKGSMFLFAAFGLVDLAYTFPANKVLRQKSEDYLSVFDGAQYVQLTELGAYLTGRSSHYTMPIQEEKGAEVVLDPDRLIISLYGEDHLKSLFLQKFADKIGEHRYKIDYASFLRDCYTHRDVEKKIKLFKTEIAPNPSQVWLAFFDQVLARASPITIEDNLLVFKLSSDKELIHLMATDSILKQYILKAENFYIIVERNNYPKVKERLETLGYFIRF